MLLNICPLVDKKIFDFYNLNFIKSSSPDFFKYQTRMLVIVFSKQLYLFINNYTNKIHVHLKNV